MKKLKYLFQKLINIYKNGSDSIRIIFFILIIILVCTLSNSIINLFLPKPPKKADLPLLDQEIEISFVDHQWENANITKICITGNISWPEHNFNSPSYDMFLEYFNALGYDVINGITDDCDATLNVDIIGKPLSAMYSNSRSCFTGYKFDAHFLLLSEDLPNLEFKISEKQDTTETVNEDQCETAYRGGLTSAWASFFKSTIMSIWGENSMIKISEAHIWGSIVHGDVCYQSALGQAKKEYLPLYINNMMENEEYPDNFCIDSLEQLGSDAENAVPYLLYLLDTLNTDHNESTREDIFDALRSITGEEIINNKLKWWSWWEEQNEK